MAGTDEVLPVPGGTEEVVVQRLDGFRARIRHNRDGSVWLEGLDGRRLPALVSGERLRVTRPVSGDATYGQPVRVVRVDEGGLGDVEIRLGGQPERNQQRRHVRVQTRDVEAVFVGPSGRDGVGVLLDVSAGGIRAALDEGEMHVGQTLHVTFALPGVKGDPDETLALDGEVVWAGTSRDGRPAVGFEFQGVSDLVESRLARWILRTQATNTLRTRD